MNKVYRSQYLNHGSMRKTGARCGHNNSPLLFLLLWSQEPLNFEREKNHKEWMNVMKE
jgi:hypothetical protein